MLQSMCVIVVSPKGDVPLRGGGVPIARDLFIKVDSIGIRILMFDLRTVVGILSQATLLLCLRLVMIFVISVIDVGWKFLASEI